MQRSGVHSGVTFLSVVGSNGTSPVGGREKGLLGEGLPAGSGMESGVRPSGRSEVLLRLPIGVKRR